METGLASAYASISKVSGEITEAARQGTTESTRVFSQIRTRWIVSLNVETRLPHPISLSGDRRVDE